MKKFWILGLATLLVIPLTTACTVSGEYKNLHNEIVEFIDEENYAQFFNGDIQFNNAGLQSDKQNTHPYISISYYEQVIKMSLTNIKKFYDTFQHVPTYNTGYTKKLCSAVIADINAFKAQVEQFNVKKENMVAQYELSSTAPEAGTNAYSDFKLDLGRLAQKANNLQLSFTNALITLYYPFEAQPSIISSSRAECGVAKTFSTLIDDYFKFAILENNFAHPDTTCNLYTSLVLLDQTLNNSTIKSNKFSTWLEEYKLFKNEHNMFLTAINSVNMNADPNTLTGASKSYYTKVMHYVDEYNYAPANASQFVNKTIELLY